MRKRCRRGYRVSCARAMGAIPQNGSSSSALNVTGARAPTRSSVSSPAASPAGDKNFGSWAL